MKEIILGMYFTISVGVFLGLVYLLLKNWEEVTSEFRWYEILFLMIAVTIAWFPIVIIERKNLRF